MKWKYGTSWAMWLAGICNFVIALWALAGGVTVNSPYKPLDHPIIGLFSIFAIIFLFLAFVIQSE